jgi:transposase-like protein
MAALVGSPITSRCGDLVQRYAGNGTTFALETQLKPTNDSWRVDETDVRVKGKWVYLYRALDSTGATIDFLLGARRAGYEAIHMIRKGQA